MHSSLVPYGASKPGLVTRCYAILEDGAVGPDELAGTELDVGLAVLAAWGAAGGPEDLDGSGVVDFGDILFVLGAWGLCP